MHARKAGVSRKNRQIVKNRLYSLLAANEKTRFVLAFFAAEPKTMSNVKLRFAKKLLNAMNFYRAKSNVYSNVEQHEFFDKIHFCRPCVCNSISIFSIVANQRGIFMHYIA